MTTDWTLGPNFIGPLSVKKKFTLRVVATSDFSNTNFLNAYQDYGVRTN